MNKQPRKGFWTSIGKVLKGIFGIGRASAKQAQKIARILNIKAQIEKLQRIDLVTAHSKVGEVAYINKYKAQVFGEAYREIEVLDGDILRGKDSTSATIENSTLNRAKNWTQAQTAQQRKRTSLARIGADIIQTKKSDEIFNAVTPLVAQVIEKIALLNDELKVVMSDKSGTETANAAFRDISSGTVDASRSAIESAGSIHEYRPQGERISASSLRVPGEKKSLVVALSSAAVVVYVGILIAAFKYSGELVGRDFHDAAIAVLFVIPGTLLVAAFSIMVRQNGLLGCSVRITPEHLPEIHKMAQEVAECLHMKCPLIFVKEEDKLNAYAVGVMGKTKSVVLYSKIVEDLTEDELRFIIGHEFTHIKEGHTFWGSLVEKGSAFEVPVLSTIYRFVFLAWSRRAEYTCDRGGLLACGSFDTSARAILKLCVGAKLAHKINIDNYVNDQVDELRKQGVFSWSEALADHPYLVRRIMALSGYNLDVDGQ